MKRLLTNLQNIWKVKELRERILLTLGLILVYRVGSFVILPGVNYEILRQASEGGSQGQKTLENLLSMFSGGGFTNASVMALGIMPYISASIIMQLLGMAVPAVQKCRMKVNQVENKSIIIQGFLLLLFVPFKRQVIYQCMLNLKGLCLLMLGLSGGRKQFLF